MAFLKALVALVTKAAGIFAAFEAIFRLIKFVWVVLLKVLKRSPALSMRWAAASGF